jgi:hypothetical protein
MTKILASFLLAAAVFWIVLIDFNINDKWQRGQQNLWISYSTTGDALLAKGKFDVAYKGYREGLAIAQRLAAADRIHIGWQSYESVSHIKIGNVLIGQGSLGFALKAYGDGLAIAERLAAADNSDKDTAWQNYLMESYEKGRSAGEAGQTR